MRANKTFSLFFTLLAVSAAAYLAVDIFYRVLQHELWHAEAVAPAVSQSPGARPDPAGASDLRPIIERDLFRARETGGGNRSEPAGLKPTGLNLALLGTVTGPAGQSFAVIEETDRKQQRLVRVGDPIQQATVKSILRGEVLLRIEDRDEVLAVRKPAASETGPGPVSRPAQPAGVAPAPDLAGAPAGDLTALLGELRLRPHLSDGREDGFRVLWIKPNSVFLQLGLRDGDVIQQVNGRTLATADDLLALQRGLRPGSPVSLQVSRRGVSRTLTAPLHTN